MSKRKNLGRVRNAVAVAVAAVAVAAVAAEKARRAHVVIAVDDLV